jgi:hypothetical protein
MKATTGRANQLVRNDYKNRPHDSLYSMFYDSLVIYKLIAFSLRL